MVAVGSHDTASAVVGVPDGRATTSAYISSGTWSLVGLELDAPVLTEEARAANFTNEGGVDGTVRFLKNVMGLWVLSECLRLARPRRSATDLGALLAGAADVHRPRYRSSTSNDPRFAGARRHARAGSRRGCARDDVEPRRPTPATIIRSHPRQPRRWPTAARCDRRRAGRPRRPEVVHVVGGGTQNDLLCQLTADASACRWSPGPVEAAALGNVLVQARAVGADLPDLAACAPSSRRTHDAVARGLDEPRPSASCEGCRA